mgnify:CR=1 FL=1
MYKICIIGPDSSEKSKFLLSLKDKYKDNEKQNRFIPTLGVELFKVQFKHYILNIWNISNDNENQWAREKNVIGADYIIAFEGYSLIYNEYLNRIKNIIIPSGKDPENDIFNKIIHDITSC